MENCLTFAVQHWKVLLTLLKDKSPCRERDLDRVEYWAITSDMKMTSQNARFCTCNREMPDTSLKWEKGSSGAAERALGLLVGSRLCGSQQGALAARRAANPILGAPKPHPERSKPHPEHTKLDIPRCPKR